MGKSKLTGRGITIRNSRKVEYPSYQEEVKPNTFCELVNQQYGYAARANVNSGDSYLSDSTIIRLDSKRFLGVRDSSYLTVFEYDSNKGTTVNLAQIYIASYDSYIPRLYGAFWISDGYIVVPGGVNLRKDLLLFKYDEKAKSLTYKSTCVLDSTWGNNTPALFKDPNTGNVMVFSITSDSFVLAKIAFNASNETLSLSNKKTVSHGKSLRSSFLSVTEFVPGIIAAIVEDTNYHSELCIADIRGGNLKKLYAESSYSSSAEALQVLDPKHLGVINPYSNSGSSRFFTQMYVFHFNDNYTGLIGEVTPMTIYRSTEQSDVVFSHYTGHGFCQNINRNTYEFMSYAGLNKFDPNTNKLTRTKTVPKDVWQSDWLGIPYLDDLGIGADIMGPIGSGAQPYTFINFERGRKCIRESQSTVNGLLISTAKIDKEGTFLQWDTIKELSEYNIAQELTDTIKNNSIQEVQNELNK